ncbi:hypothetical protein KQI84_16740 [bacterium]|nr:hypothetical protein [bacterium]
MLLIVSDLHLGCGDEREDFLLWGDRPQGPKLRARAAATARLDRLFAEFLRLKMAHAGAAGLVPTLLLLGDTFDLWQVQEPRESPRDALERILTFHTDWVVGMREWIRTGGEIHLVVGNHDQPIVHPDAWNLLSEILPSLNRRIGGKPTHYFADEAIGLYAEHGHRWDPHNRIRRLDNPDASCIGREVVRRLVNRVEHIVPWIDKGAGVADVIRIAQSVLDPDLLDEAFRALAPAVRHTSLLARLLHPWKKRRREADWQALARRELAAMNRGIDRALAPRPEGTTGPLPANCRFFASGHTHQAMRAQSRGNIERFNPGTWRPFALIEDNSPVVMTQPLTYAELLPDGIGGWELAVRSAAKLRDN